MKAIMIDASNSSIGTFDFNPHEGFISGVPILASDDPLVIEKLLKALGKKKEIISKDIIDKIKNHLLNDDLAEASDMITRYFGKPFCCKKNMEEFMSTL